MIRSPSLVILVLLMLVQPVQVGSETMTISGTVMSLDKDAGTIVLAEIGPWRVRGGVTQITRRTVSVIAATEFTQIRRADDAGPTGWRGDFVEMAIEDWALKKGDFVTVRVQKEDQRLTALTVAVIVPAAP